MRLIKRTIRTHRRPAEAPGPNTWTHRPSHAFAGCLCASNDETSWLACSTVHVQYIASGAKYYQVLAGKHAICHRVRQHLHLLFPNIQLSASHSGRASASSGASTQASISIFSSLLFPHHLGTSAHLWLKVPQALIARIRSMLAVHTA